MRSAWLIPLLTLSIAACAQGVGNDPQADDDDDSGGGGPGGGGINKCQGVGFAEFETSWSLPSYGLDYNGDAILRSPSGEASCPTGGVLRYSTVDLTGDGRADLVVTSHGDSDTATGTTRWLLHENTGEGFATDAIDWSLPPYPLDYYGEPMLGALAGTNTCSDSGGFTYGITDVTGDGQPDLVIASNCSSDTETGLSRWLVHVNTGSGFSPTATDWTVPDYGYDYYAAGMLDALVDSATCASGAAEFQYDLADLTGDHQPDLVVTSECDTSAGTGSDRWLVYRNTGSGFSTEPLDWALPPSYASDYYGDPPFKTSAGSTTCATAGLFTFGLVDMNGDEQPDLLVTSNCYDDAMTGVSRWLVHTNTGTGFGPTAVNWMLPAYGLDASGDAVLQRMTGDTTCTTSGVLSYTTTDLTGDGKVDLVVTRNCNDDAQTGLTRWLIHSNTGGGFESEALPWPLPAYGLDYSGDYVLDQTSDGTTCASSGTLQFSTFDLNGDQRPDLVLTEHCDDDLSTGASRWLFHTNVCGNSE